jgi:YHS domain-containing protein
MTDSRQLVETYLKALHSGDSKVRDLLTDDFHFWGPSTHFHGADAFLKGAGHAAAGTRTVEIEKVFASGSEVAAFYVLHLDHRVNQVRVAERFRLEDGHIAASTLIMDTASFLTRPRRDPGSVAIDPVCHMEVDVAAPAAIREHNGVAYYFCSSGCAEAFAHEPEKYLAA